MYNAHARPRENDRQNVFSLTVMVCLLGLVDLGAEHRLLRLLFFEQVTGLDRLPARLLSDLLGALGPESARRAHEEHAPH